MHLVQLARGVAVAHAPDPAPLPQQPDDLGPAQHGERRVRRGVLDEEVEEVPLRHEGEIAVPAGQPPEVRDREGALVGGDGDLLGSLLRHLRERLPEPRLVEDPQGGRVDGVAAEVAQEVRVLLQHQHVHAGAGEQQREQRPCRPTPRDDDGRALHPATL